METNPAKAPKNEKILIIEGDQNFGGRLSEALMTEGYKVITASSGADGIKAITDNMPHLILLDVVLPDMEGYELLKQKHAEPLLQKIPVYLMSTQGVPINMRLVPPGSVAEFILTLHTDPRTIVSRINRLFGYESSDASLSQDEIKPAKGDGSGRKRIIWVEDDKLIGNILEKKFAASDFEVSHAKNGEEALALLENTVPQGIVLDLLLPGMSGFDILQKIRTMDKQKGVPVMILSNLSKPSDIEKAKMLGAKKFIVKAAISLDQIVEEVREMCN